MSKPVPLRIIGHRGAKGLAPENTLASLQAGLNAGADGLEFDVRVTSDHIPILCHDESLTEHGTHLRIGQHSYADLKLSKPDLATLREALELIDGKALPMIEVKAGEPVGPIAKILYELIGDHELVRGMYAPSGLQLASKSQQTLRELHQALPEVPMLVIESWSGVRAGLRARQLGTKQISMRSWWLWRGYLRAMQRRGYQITAYTMNNPSRVAYLRPYLYAVVTDYPDRFTAPIAAVPIAQVKAPEAVTL